MRLVKAISAFFLMVGCDAPAPAALSPALPDCRLILRSPGPLHLKRIAPDGTVVEVGEVRCATCVAGSGGSFARADRDGVIVEVGGVSSRAVPVPGSPVGSPTLAGVIVGGGFVGIHEPGGLRVIDPEGVLPPLLALPALEAGERVEKIARRVGGGAFAIKAHGKDNARRLVPFGVFDKYELRDRNSVPVARLDGVPTRAVTFARGERITLPEPVDAIGMSADDDQVLLHRPDPLGALLVWRNGAIDTLPAKTAIALLSSGDPVLLHPQLRKVERVIAAGPSGIKEVLGPRPGVDLAGAPLEEGSRAMKMAFAVHQTDALLIERIEDRACDYTDRVHLVDLDAGTVRTVADGPGMRLTPIFGGGAFHFIEASVELSSP